MARLGIMQGRLAPPIGGKIQAFPLPFWEDEFPLSEELGLTCLEWIFERPEFEKNPLWSDEGIARIKELSQRHRVAVTSIVADYFMEVRLFGPDQAEVADAVDTLDKLIARAAQAGILLIEIPLVDNSSLQSDADKQDFARNLEPLLAKAASLGVKISLETDLPPGEFKAFIESFGPARLWVNYDMGNSAALGFDPASEIGLLGPYIANVHIKDRVKGGGTVPLGTGDTDFEAVFAALARAGYSDDFILQSARRDLEAQKQPISPRQTIAGYQDFLKQFLKSFK